jgi:HEPN domain-containing protein
MKPPEDLVDAAKELDKAYIPTRYPNALRRAPPMNTTVKKRPSA